VWVRREVSLLTLAFLPAVLLRQLRQQGPWTTRRTVGAALGVGVVIGSSTIRVVVNRRGLEVGFGPWGWPRRLIPIERIASAGAERLTPLYYGLGLGYRAVPGRSRVILWPGPAIVVTMTDGHSFGVNVRDANRAADLLNELVNNRTTRPAAPTLNRARSDDA
jgi:hypothetical protein